MLLPLAIIFIGFIVYYIIIKPHKYWKEKKIPYLKPWPLLGNFGRNVLKKVSFVDNMNEIYKATEGKRYVGIYQFLQPILLIRDIDLIKQITVKDFDNFPDHRPVSSMKTDPAIRKNMFMLKRREGWHDIRTTLSPAFTSSKMKILFALIQESLERFVEYFQNEQSSPIIIELLETLSRITNDVIATTAFGLECDSLRNKDNEFYARGKNLIHFTGFRNFKLLLASTNPNLLKFFNVKLLDEEDVKFFKNLIDTTIKFRQERGINRPDMLQLLIEARNRGKIEEKDAGVEDSSFAVVRESNLKKRSKVALTEDLILSQAYVFFFAGFETVSVALCHTAYELVINPDIQKRLQEEIDETFAESDDGKIAYEALLKMKYLDCVVSEALRLRPPLVTMDRMSIKPYTIEPKLPGEKPLRLDADTILWISAWAIHHDPKYYPNPEKFDPERFNDKNKHKIKPFTYLPFGAGPRNCIGSRFALMEVKLVLVKLLQHFDILPTERTQIPMKIGKANFSPIPAAGVWVELRKRNN